MVPRVTCLILIAGGIAVAAQEQPNVETTAAFTNVEAAVCSTVVDREPVNVTTFFPEGVDSVFCWTRFEGATDSTSVTHIWIHGEETKAEVHLPVNSSAWRTWSYKTMLPEWTGDWQVRIVDERGNIIKSLSFTIGQPPESTETAAPPPADTIGANPPDFGK